MIRLIKTSLLILVALFIPSLLFAREIQSTIPYVDLSKSSSKIPLETFLPPDYQESLPRLCSSYIVDLNLSNSVSNIIKFQTGSTYWLRSIQVNERSANLLINGYERFLYSGELINVIDQLKIKLLSVLPNVSARVQVYENCLTDNTYDDRFEYIVYNNQHDFQLVCERPCSISPDLLIQKFRGELRGLNEMRTFLGINFTENLLPIYSHVAGDQECGSAEEMLRQYGFISGFSERGSNEKGLLCTFDLEKPNRILPFNIENAGRIQDQVLSTHELGHILFFTRSSTPYNVQESFVKIVSHKISGLWDGNDILDSNFAEVLTACDSHFNHEGENLAYLLCQRDGFDFANYQRLFQSYADIYAHHGRYATLADFKAILDGIVGHDTSSTFHEAGISLP